MVQVNNQVFREEGRALEVGTQVGEDRNQAHSSHCREWVCQEGLVTGQTAGSAVRSLQA